jgi:hypothetical protein
MSDPQNIQAPERPSCKMSKLHSVQAPKRSKYKMSKVSKRPRPQNVQAPRHHNPKTSQLQNIQSLKTSQSAMGKLVYILLIKMAPTGLWYVLVYNMYPSQQSLLLNIFIAFSYT